MSRLFHRLWHEEDAVTSPEWAFIATILVLGAVTGLVMNRSPRLDQAEQPPAAVSQR